ncbi:MAG: DUF4093 domain-containing protein [Clostridiales bacterium]|nr:DUF4093 domain-containing protein [Clostridiales bacterium]
MLKINEAVIVEDRYDKIKLSNILDILIIETNGFGIYKDKQKMKFIRRLAAERGIIVLTDSDSGGFQIRNYICAGILQDRIKHIYIPDVYGKERRKAASSKEGKLGIEGMSEEVLLRLFEEAEVTVSRQENTDFLTSYDLLELGIAGTPNAKENKKKLLKALDLPELLSTNSLLSYLNSSAVSKEEL